jgi:hypothetical protein
MTCVTERGHFENDPLHPTNNQVEPGFVYVEVTAKLCDHVNPVGKRLLLADKVFVSFRPFRWRISGSINNDTCLHG